MGEKKTQSGLAKKSLMIISAILHLVTISAVVYLLIQEESTVNDYADKNHVHSEYADDSHSHSEYARDSHSHDDYVDDSHSHPEYAWGAHSHSSDEISFKTNAVYLPRIYGNETLNSKIRDIESNLTKLEREIDSKAKKRHSHY